MKNERKSYFSLTGVRTPVNASLPEALGIRSTCGNISDDGRVRREMFITYELLISSVANVLVARLRMLSTDHFFPFSRLLQQPCPTTCNVPVLRIVVQNEETRDSVKKTQNVLDMKSAT